jgi:cysteine synthase
LKAGKGRKKKRRMQWTTWKKKLKNQKKQEYKMAKRIIIAGGGTGGHIFPAIAIANALKKLSPPTEILFVGAKGKWKWKKSHRQDTGLKALTLPD